jgi:hypothetical protein
MSGNELRHLVDKYESDSIFMKKEYHKNKVDGLSVTYENEYYIVNNVA